MTMKSAAARRAKVIAYIVTSIFVLRFLYEYTSGLISGRPSGHDRRSGTSSRLSEAAFQPLTWSEAQCRTAFPGLTQEVDLSVSQGPFNLTRLIDSYQPGIFQVRIEDDKLYVLFANKHDNGRVTQIQRSAVLHALHRAIVTAPESLPNTTLTITINDSPRPHALSFSRPTEPSFARGTYWLMPHYSSWTYTPTITTLDDALSAISLVESSTSWENKIDKAVWRGTTWFNPISNQNLRPKLVASTKGKEWADIETKKERGSGKSKISNALAIEDFCRYKYVVYTDGITYSGRLHYHQACTSVLLTPPILHMQHLTHLIRPVYADELSDVPSAGGTSSRHVGWETSYPVHEANAVFLQKDWADLEQTIAYLRRNPRVAEGIAQRQRDLFVGQGYLSPAAEACYWRALVKGWSKMVRLNEEEWKGSRGTRWEVFSVTGELDNAKV